MSRPGAPPISVSRSIDAVRLSTADPCDALICLGSYWPYSKHSHESHIVKGFKECNPTPGYEPHITRLCDIYARLIVERFGSEHFDWVARVLSSTERQPEPTRPMALLESILCKRLGAQSLTHLFFKSEARPAMRLVGQLSGPDVLRRRIQYAAQDLFVAPAPTVGRALLIDDIYNTGASMRVYAQALREFAGIESVVGVNIAATRFKGGKDGHGMLQVDTSAFESHEELRLAWVDSKSVCHASESCGAISGKASGKLRFLAEKLAAPCTMCYPSPKPRRRLWGLLP